MSTPGEFNTFIKDLITQAASSHSAACVPGVFRRKWQIPDFTPQGSSPDADHIQSPRVIALSLPRDVSNAEYVRTSQTSGSPNSGRVGQLIAYKTMVDYTASYERALQASLASRTRCLQWSGSRRYGHGTETGSVFTVVKQHIITMLEASVIQNNEPTPPQNNEPTP